MRLRRIRILLASGALALASCGRNSSVASGGEPVRITGTVWLTLAAEPSFGSSFWAVLRRDGSDEWKTERIQAGARTAIPWRETVHPPRDWKLKFGPSRHPTYQLLVLPEGPSAPEIALERLGSYHDPERSLAIAYFAVPMDGQKDLRITLARPAPLVVSTVDSAGKPLAGLRVVGIRTPRYVFEDGFDPERVDAMQLSWSWDFWNFDNVPSIRLAPSRLLTAKTDAAGTCRLEDFVGWAGISARDERFVHPRSVLAMGDLRALRLCVCPNPASVRLTAEGLPGRDTTITERGLVVEGDWPLPEGSKPARWSQSLSFLQAKTAEFFTPCREVRIRPQSPVHRVASGEVIGNLAPGESRKHTAVLEELPHLTIEGEVQFEASDRLAREHCGIELYRATAPETRVRAVGSIGGPGVPRSGRVPFAFHIVEPGPYTVVVRTGSYSSAVVRNVRAPAEDLVVRVALDRKNLPCSLDVRDSQGREAGGYVVGAWPHRELVNDFISGTQPSGRPGENTFVIHSEAGDALLADVKLEEGRPAALQATLSPGTRIRGRLVDLEGRPVAGQWVHLSWPGYYRMPSAFRWLADLTGQDGRFEIDHVPPGSWRLYLRGTGARAGDLLSVPSAQAGWDAGDQKVPRSEAPGTQ